MVQTSASFRRGAQDVDGSISLSEIISALRLRGMAAILFRLKRQVRTALEAATA